MADPEPAIVHVRVELSALCVAMLLFARERAKDKDKHEPQLREFWSRWPVREASGAMTRLVSLELVKPHYRQNGTSLIRLTVQGERLAATLAIENSHHFDHPPQETQR